MAAVKAEKAWTCQTHLSHCVKAICRVKPAHSETRPREQNRESADHTIRASRPSHTQSDSSWACQPQEPRLVWAVFLTPATESVLIQRLYRSNWLTHNHNRLHYCSPLSTPFVMWLWDFFPPHPPIKAEHISPPLDFSKLSHTTCTHQQDEAKWARAQSQPRPGEAWIVSACPGELLPTPGGGQALAGLPVPGREHKKWLQLRPT